VRSMGEFRQGEGGGSLRLSRRETSLGETGAPAITRKREGTPDSGLLKTKGEAVCAKEEGGFVVSRGENFVTIKKERDRIFEESSQVLG